MHCNCIPKENQSYSFAKRFLTNVLFVPIPNFNVRVRFWDVRDALENMRQYYDTLMYTSYL